ncbi:MAG: type II secretion system F family protein [Pseudomonadota bacterium]
MSLDQLLSGAGGDQLVMYGLPAMVGLLLVILFLIAGDANSARLKKRIDRVKGEQSKKGAVEKTISIRKSTTDSDIKLLDSFIKRALPRPEVLRSRLEGAGLNFSAGNYVLINLIVAAATIAGGLWSGFMPTAAAFLLGLIVGIGLPHLILTFLGKRRKAKFIANFPEAIDLMVRGLKSGLPITESIKTAAEEIPNPVGIELQRVVDEIKLGAKIDTALETASKRLSLQEFNYLTIALSIQSETGGNLAETLENLSDVLRKRRQLKLKIKALSSEAKASAYIIGSLPFVMAIMINLTNAGYLVPLFEDSRGNFLLFLGFLSFAVGAGVMYKMVKFEI